MTWETTGGRRWVLHQPGSLNGCMKQSPWLPPTELHIRKKKTTKTNCSKTLKFCTSINRILLCGSSLSSHPGTSWTALGMQSSPSHHWMALLKGFSLKLAKIKLSRPLYSSARAAITMCHRQGDRNNRQLCLSVLEAGLVLPEASLFGLQWPPSPWVLTWSSLCVCVCPNCLFS